MTKTLTRSDATAPLVGAAAIVRAIDERRRELGMSCYAIGLSVGMSQTNVRRLLGGIALSPRLDTVVAVARAVGMELRLIAHGEEVENGQN